MIKNTKIFYNQIHNHANLKFLRVCRAVYFALTIGL